MPTHNPRARRKALAPPVGVISLRARSAALGERPDGTRVMRRPPSAPSRHPSVTVLVPSYNYARFLRDCADSVLTQSDVDVRLLIVDDCSTDDTPRVTEDLLVSDSRVSVIRHERNRGHIPSVNEAFAQVDTESLVKLDADDLLAPRSLARAVALLEALPGVGFVYGRPQHFSSPLRKRPGSATKSWTVWPGDQWVARRCRSGNNAISQPEVVLRTALLREVGGIREDLPHTSDLHLWLQLASISDVGRVNGPIQGYYRVHEASMQHTVHAGQLFGLRARRDAFDAAFDGTAGTLLGASELSDQARRSIAAEALEQACHAFDRGSPEEEAEPIESFVAFAIETWPAAHQLPEWTALQRRKSVGVRRARRHPRFFADAVVRRAVADVSRWRWRHTGEL
jgi:Glycosyl transferase family 2